MQTILIVDDSEEWRKLVTAALSGPEVALIGAASASQAMRILLRDCIDLVLLDLSLPGVDGLAFLEMIRDDLGWKSLPVMIVTGGGQISAVPRLTRWGVAGCMVKSRFSIAELRSAVTSLLDQQRRIAEAA